VTNYGKKLQTLQGKRKHDEAARKFGMEENQVVLFFCNVEECFFISLTLTPQKAFEKNHITRVS